MVRCHRLFSTSSPLLKKKQELLIPGYKLKCGLEIHSQLDTKFKLFSLSKTSFQSTPNSKISYFDASLPGTQPLLNPEALLFALKAAKALNSTINTFSTFDRKHYFYGDQPLGYQITQHYQPYAQGGFLKLLPHDNESITGEKIINIEQIQIEQDTGKSIYTELENEAFSKIDLNRTNIPLIEMVTKPDFETPEEIRCFIKKYQNLVRHLGICTGDLETGAMRVDVNISVNNGHRVELKNLSTTSSVINAIKYEYKRQIKLIESGETSKVIQETRGWDGSKTVRLRTKEGALDYRYMPDPELPPIILENGINESLKLPKLPDELMIELKNAPYNLSNKDASILVNDLKLLNYYFQLFEETVIKNKVESKLPGNWVIHELLGGFTKLQIEFNPNLINVLKLSELLISINNEQITKSSAKLLLQHLMNNPGDLKRPILELIDDYDLGKESNVDQDLIGEIINQVLEEQSEIVELIKSGKRLNSVKFLVGQCMRLSQGKIKPNIFEDELKLKLGI
ncbi:hypothetical protein BN7_4876 [Wickerhamomyces ciferrii]|uniref:Glutamyl-tRNA(Gln) amidotransferase subunit B, mitochondrial n=1 Tax=Wickerhamomyces ciferrii (strain ATCC 14091 / BCRC 22168 / CBS 111 / JCM 3599 / NBRC 0793 / NRRL Y-1031 F-60-10) TaxID=1206466 RepID=K0KV45_WICCF|nr:uncharacterized protein BN7_4876 [Wickerhamomyces ciferrii]CCH45294.1 hypothetical protein BN7_4876 [Wickerhamomyces ciferrii]